MKKEKIKNIMLIIIVALVTSFVTAYGVSSTFDSSNVCYKVDSNTGASVQDTIDDLYGRASDYSELKSYFKNNPTSYFDGEWLRLNSSSTSVPRGTIIYDANNKQRSSFMYDVGTDTTYLDAYTSTGAFGKLNLRGNPVTINGVDYTNVTRVATTLNTSNVNTGGSSGVYYTRVGKIVTVEIYDIGPKNYTGGVVQIASDLPKGATANAVTAIICSLGNNSVCHRVALDGTNLKWWWTTTGVTNLASGSFTYIAE